MVRTVSISLLILCTGACATQPLKPLGQGEPFQIEEDERRLWNRSEEEEDVLDRSKSIYTDAELIKYLDQVVDKLIPQEVRREDVSFQVRVIKNPTLNAFAFPNGILYLHTGILTRIENEAQLATLLAHELSHVIHRHALLNMRNFKQQTAIGATLAGVFPIVGLLGTLGTTAAIYGYSQDLEHQADEEGLKLTIRAGYDPKESPNLFIHLKNDIEEQNIKEPFFFGTHPRIQERINNYQVFIGKISFDREGEIGAERFIQRILPVLLENSRLDLSMGRFISAEKGLRKVLEHQPHSAMAYYYMGEIYRQRGVEDDKQKAIESYEKAIRHDPSFAEPHKALGLIYLKNHSREAARGEFERYLALRPQAEDRGYIERYLEDLGAN